MPILLDEFSDYAQPEGGELQARVDEIRRSQQRLRQARAALLVAMVILIGFLTIGILEALR